MATPHQAYHLQLLNHLRTILAALGEAEQVPEESHVLFLERFDELLTLLPQTHWKASTWARTSCAR